MFFSPAFLLSECYNDCPIVFPSFAFIYLPLIAVTVHAMLEFKRSAFHFGGFIVEDKRRYKLYKHGKLWCCTAVTIASLTIGMAALHADAYADNNQITTSLVTDSSTSRGLHQPRRLPLLRKMRFQSTRQLSTTHLPTMAGLTITRSLLMKMVKIFSGRAAGTPAVKAMVNVTVTPSCMTIPPKEKSHDKGWHR